MRASLRYSLRIASGRRANTARTALRPYIRNSRANWFGASGSSRGLGGRPRSPAGGREPPRKRPYGSAAIVGQRQVGLWQVRLQAHVAPLPVMRIADAQRTRVELVIHHAELLLSL